MSDPEIDSIAKKNNVSPSTILISYHINKGTVVLPKSISEKRISDNVKSDLFEQGGFGKVGRAGC